MDHQPFPPAPPPAPPPRHSNILTFLVVGLVALGAAGFFFLLFGNQFLLALGIFLGVALLAGFHYVTWGRAMTEQAKKQAKAEMEGE
jgi:hypothetical protein